MHMLSALLLSQAFSAAASHDGGRLVRSSSRVVLPDGRIEEEAPEAKRGALVEQSRSARTEDMLADIKFLVKNEDADRKSIEDMQHLAKMILEDVISDAIFQDDMIKSLLKVVDDCNSGFKSQEQTIVSTTEKEVGTSRVTHATCREEEVQKENHKNGRCSELDAFLKGIKTPAAKPTGRDPAVKWVQGESAYWCEQGPTVTGLNEACKKAEKEHSEHKNDCDREQGAFELGFCTWRTQLLDACEDLQTCYDAAVENYDEHVKITEVDVSERLTLEFKSLNKILCYIDVWMNDNNTSTVDAEQYDKCEELDPTQDAVKALHINYLKVHSKAACDTSSVDIYPGAQEFPNVEYSKFSEYVLTPITCLPRPTKSK
jgi:hypothetical protein